MARYHGVEWIDAEVTEFRAGTERVPDLAIQKNEENPNCTRL